MVGLDLGTEPPALCTVWGARKWSTGVPGFDAHTSLGVTDLAVVSGSPATWQMIFTGHRRLSVRPWKRCERSCKTKLFA